MDYTNLKTLKGNYSIFKFVIISLCILSGVLAILYAREVAKSSIPPYVFVLDESGNVAPAVRKTIGVDEVKAEVTNHIAMFTSLMFENDQHTYDRNIERALQLAGDVGMELVEQKKQEKEYNNMVKLNIRTTINIDFDSFVINPDLTGSFSFVRSVTRNEEETVNLKISVSFKVVRTNMQRTRSNPHAMTIVAYTITNTQRLQ